MENRYIEEHNETYYVRGHRIPLKTLIYCWHEGESPEAIQQSFSSLSLVEVYGALTSYLEQQEMLDQHFAQINEEEQRIITEWQERQNGFREELKRRFAVLKAQGEAPH